MTDKRQRIEFLLRDIAALDNEIEDLEASSPCDGCSPQTTNILLGLCDRRGTLYNELLALGYRFDSAD